MLPIAIRVSMVAEDNDYILECQQPLLELGFVLQKKSIGTSSARSRSKKAAVLTPIRERV
jgi:hypothetical protein